MILSSRRAVDVLVFLIFLFAYVVAPVSAGAQDTVVLSRRDIFHPIHGRNGMVASQEAVATRVGLDILRRGGNAVDAAVAIGFTLAVTLPRAGNLGGGGFMMVHVASLGETVAIDYRETAPAAATRDMYLDADGQVDSRRSRFSYLSVGVPGTVAGMALALERYGSMALPEVMAPAIRLAEDGITVSADLAASLESRRRRFRRWPASMQVFFKADGTGYAVLPGGHGRPLRRRLGGARRAHHPGRPGELPGGGSPAGAWHLSRP